MDRAKLFSLLRQLSLPQGEWVIFGGACLTARGIRETSDLELFVSEELYGDLEAKGWKAKVTGSTGAHYVTKAFKGITILAFITCGSEKWRPDVEEYLKNPEVINGVPFMPLTDMYAWKAATARPRDIEDLALIEAYWNE